MTDFYLSTNETVYNLSISLYFCSVFLVNPTEKKRVQMTDFYLSTNQAVEAMERHDILAEQRKGAMFWQNNGKAPCSSGATERHNVLVDPKIRPAEQVHVRVSGLFT